MTLLEAFEEFSKSEDFKNVAKVNDGPGSKFRIYLSRFKSGKLKAGAITELLMVHGYTITADKAEKVSKDFKKKK